MPNDPDLPEIPPGVKGIDLITKDPLGLGEEVLSRFFRKTDNVELMRSVIVDERPKDKNLTEEEYQQWWSENGKRWENIRRMSYLSEIAANTNCPSELLTEIVKQRLVENTNADDDLFNAAASGGAFMQDDPTQKVRTPLICNPHTTVNDLKQLAETKNWFQLTFLIEGLEYKNPRPEFLRMVYESCVTRQKGTGTANLFLALAKSRHTPSDILLGLCREYSDPAQIQTVDWPKAAKFRDTILEPILKNSSLPSEGRMLLEEQVKRIEQL